MQHGLPFSSLTINFPFFLEKIIWHTSKATSGERSFGTGWEGHLVSVVATGTTKSGLKVPF
jgi:hypothetical protein